MSWRSLVQMARGFGRNQAHAETSRAVPFIFLVGIRGIEHALAINDICCLPFSVFCRMANIACSIRGLDRSLPC